MKLSFSKIIIAVLFMLSLSACTIDDEASMDYPVLVAAPIYIPVHQKTVHHRRRYPVADHGPRRTLHQQTASRRLPVVDGRHRHARRVAPSLHQQTARRSAPALHQQTAQRPAPALRQKTARRPMLALHKATKKSAAKKKNDARKNKLRHLFGLVG